MNGPEFSLQPFPRSGVLLPLALAGSITRHAQVLAIRYALRGRLAELVIPPPVSRPARRNELWRTTCFEFFLAAKNSPGYWEFNLSPAGHWNVYRFAAYRQGMTEEEAFTSLPFQVGRARGSWRLVLEFDLAGIARGDQTFEVGIAAVIKPRGGEATYWALTHPGPQPDFHRRDSFILEL